MVFSMTNASKIMTSNRSWMVCFVIGFVLLALASIIAEAKSIDANKDSSVAHKAALTAPSATLGHHHHVHVHPIAEKGASGVTKKRSGDSDEYEYYDDPEPEDTTTTTVRPRKSCPKKSKTTTTTTPKPKSKKKKSKTTTTTPPPEEETDEPDDPEEPEEPEDDEEVEGDEGKSRSGLVDIDGSGVKVDAGDSKSKVNIKHDDEREAKKDEKSGVKVEVNTRK